MASEQRPLAPPSPLAGEGLGVEGSARYGALHHGAIAPDPSSGPSGHLLPQGEKGDG